MAVCGETMRSISSNASTCSMTASRDLLACSAAAALFEPAGLLTRVLDVGRLQDASASPLQDRVHWIHQ
ncbi:hypothetical protein SAMN05421869_112261 [Nonomuraea jiangxiensis]|uniref:Uncharacterized protein n=1 Tax=Nonomuraea jiangxiensis TaxID=633440 RepID=A0A1G8WV40_9ACTN|nr:hypothetical protein SAMN05421869_112261 [Nonomuraea jiangxiensis]